MFAFGRRLADERRGAPREDIMTALVQAGLTQQEMDTYFVLLATAGNETTRHTITHGLLALLEHPDQLAALRADPSLGRTATEEMLRWATPVHHFRRTATEDVALGERTIAAGDKVTTWFTSGNRDEEHFRRPRPLRHHSSSQRAPQLRPGRHPSLPWRPPRAAGDPDHLRGAARARRRRSSSTGPAERLRSNFFNGIKRMPVRVTPMIALRRIDHVALRVADLDEAAARWAQQFGLHVRARDAEAVRLACDDEPYCLELIAGGEPGLDHVGWELAADCTLEQARAAPARSRRRDDASTATACTPPTRTATASSSWPSASRPAVSLPTRARPSAAPAGHPRKLGHVNFLTAGLAAQLALLHRGAGHAGHRLARATAACGCTSTPTTT